MTVRAVGSALIRMLLLALSIMTTAACPTAAVPMQPVKPEQTMCHHPMSVTSTTSVAQKAPLQPSVAFPFCQVVEPSAQEQAQMRSTFASTVPSSGIQATPVDHNAWDAHDACSSDEPHRVGFNLVLIFPSGGDDSIEHQTIELPQCAPTRPDDQASRLLGIHVGFEQFAGNDNHFAQHGSCSNSLPFSSDHGTDQCQSRQTFRGAQHILRDPGTARLMQSDTSIQPQQHWMPFQWIRSRLLPTCGEKALSKHPHRSLCIEGPCSGHVTCPNDLTDAVVSRDGSHEPYCPESSSNKRSRPYKDST
jgi:hypothetical protein